MSVLLNPQEFADFLIERKKAGDGYIMCAIGQDPKDLSEWYFSGQYSGSQLTKANYWRENAERVWDCQGMEDGYETDMRGERTNVRARNNYATYCTIKGTGTIPSKYRVPGAAVFVYNGSYISHVGFLVKPVDANDPDGDWYVVEARGVMYGVKMYKLSKRSWNRWGLMDTRFDYTAVLTKYHGAAAEETVATVSTLGSRTLRNGSKGEDVTEMQTILMELGYDLPEYGADGDFGDETETAVRAFQTAAYDLEVDGIYGEMTHAALMEALDDTTETDEDTAAEETGQVVKVTSAGRWRIRKGPSTSFDTLTTVPYGTELPYVATADTGWYMVEINGTTGYISNKCAEVFT